MNMIKKYNFMKALVISLVALFAFSSVSAQTNKTLKLWYNEPTPNTDKGWVNRSIPMGNGYMGVNVFGGTATERIQITENSLFANGNNIYIQIANMSCMLLFFEIYKCSCGAKF